MRFLLCLLLVSAAQACVADGVFFGTEGTRLKEPSQEALVVFQDRRQDLILQVTYEGATGDFAWVVPTPSEPVVGACSPDVFKELRRFCDPPRPSRRRAGGVFSGTDAGVEVLQQTRVGIYELTVLRASDPEALGKWLKERRFLLSGAADRVLRLYVRAGWCFTAVRVDAREPGNGGDRRIASTGELPPIRLTFSTDRPVYPLRISSLNRGVARLSLFVVADAPVSAAGFATRFREEVPADTLARITASRPAFDRPMWLTWLARDMDTAVMDRDLYFQPIRVR